MITTASLSKEHRNHDTALRHKIRNLRAKVRLLLPLDLCRKEQRRSKNLIKMDYNRRMELTCHDKHRWNLAKESMSQLYIPEQPIPIEKHLFEKLSNAEVEQIKEDKLYYVGEEFLDQFDQFLQARQKQKNKNSSTNAKPFHQANLLHSVPDLNHKSSLSVGEGNFLQKERAFQKRMKRIIRMEGIQAKRKLKTEQDLTRRTYIKIKGRQNMQRHLQNYVRAYRQKEDSIRQRNKENMLKTCQNYKRKYNAQQIGQIRQLSQQLRSLCLRRQSDSAKLMFLQ